MEFLKISGAVTAGMLGFYTLVRGANKVLNGKKKKKKKK